MKILGNKLISECTAYDFKDELERKKIRHWLKSVSAFANKEGGALYFGVSNDGTVTGLKDIQADSDFISEKINAHLDPGHSHLQRTKKAIRFWNFWLSPDSSRPITSFWMVPARPMSAPATKVSRQRHASF